MLLNEPQDCLIGIGKGEDMHTQKGILLGFVREKSEAMDWAVNYDVALVVMNGGRLKKVEIDKVIIIPEEEGD